MNGLLSEYLKVIKGLDPVADAFSGTVASDVINMGLYDRALFVVQKGVGATGTATITMQATAANTTSSPTAIPFKYRAVSSGDTAGSITDATTAGFTTSAASSELYLCEVRAENMPDGKPWLHLQSVEVVDSPIVGSILILLGAARFTGATLPTAIA